MNTEISPSTIAPPAANYAHAVLVDSPTRTLHTSGVVPVSPDGSVPQGIHDQTEVVWANIVAILTEASMTVNDIVSITTYVVNSEPLADIMAATKYDEGTPRHLMTFATMYQNGLRIGYDGIGYACGSSGCRS